MFHKYFKYLNTLNEDYIVEDIEGMKKYYPNIPNEQFQVLVELDPTYKKGSKNAGTYGKWILGLANKNRGTIEGAGHITDVLQRFEENKNNLKNKDIGSFKTIADLENYLDDENSYKELSDRQKLRQVQKAVHNTNIEKDADLVYTDDSWVVYVPKTYEASCKLGRGTTWCTASTERDYYYNDYISKGKLYIIVNRQDPEEKYQFHFETGSFMDKDDEPISVVDFLDKPENAGLMEFFTPMLDKAYGIQEDGMGHYTLTYREFTEGVNEWMGRDSWSEEFLTALFNPEDVDYLFEAFRIWPGEASEDFQYLDLDAIPQSVWDLMQLLDWTKADVEELSTLSDFNDIDIQAAWAGAAAEAETVGAIQDIQSDFSLAIDAVFTKNGISYTADSSYINLTIPRNLAIQLINNYSSIDDPDTGIAYGLGRQFGKEFREPQYGWSGFDQDTFNDVLEMRLIEVAQERGL